MGYRRDHLGLTHHNPRLLGLAGGAEVGASLAEDDVPDGSPAADAGFVGSAVGCETFGEVTSPSVR